jgi:tight adherence protein B
MDPALASLATAALAFIAVLGAGFAFAGAPTGSRATKRVQKVSSSGARRNVHEDQQVKRRAATADALKALSDRQRSSRKRLVSSKGRLAQAGLNIAENTFWMASAAVGAVFAVTALVMSAPLIAVAGAAVVGGLGLPRWVLNFMTQSSQRKFSSQLAEGIDVIVRGVKSSLPLHQCLQIIARVSPAPLNAEYQRICDGHAMGVPLDQNLQRFYETMPLPEVNFFNIVLIIQRKAGGNLSEALGNLSTVLRARKLMREKIKALSAEANMSAMIIGAMPFLVAGMLTVVNPGYLFVLVETEPGRIILIACAISLSIGVWVMRKMVNFKF